MTNHSEKLTHSEIQRLNCPVRCNIWPTRISSVGDFLTILASVTHSREKYWFRGHRSSDWQLVPSALRYRKKLERETSLRLLDYFRRYAEFKLSRPPGESETLKWMQLAQHYGVPTRLLDWTESALFALYFACELVPVGEAEQDGIVFLMNPKHLQSLLPSRLRKVLNGNDFKPIIDRYLSLGGSEQKNGLPTIPIEPIWNSERLILQRGVFTLHGSRAFALDSNQAPSLLALPIMSSVKHQLRSEMSNLGIDEMAIFPEIEHIGVSLKKRFGLL